MPIVIVFTVVPLIFQAQGNVNPKDESSVIPVIWVPVAVMSIKPPVGQALSQAKNPGSVQNANGPAQAELVAQPAFT